MLFESQVNKLFGCAIPILEFLQVETLDYCPRILVVELHYELGRLGFELGLGFGDFAAAGVGG